MKRIFDFRIKKENGLRYTAKVEVELRDEGKGPVFSSSAFVGNGRRFEMGGQCLDTIKNDYIFLKKSDEVIFTEIHDLWERNHLNCMNAGTERQRVALKEGYNDWYNKVHDGLVKHRFTRYELECEFLKTVDLYKDSEYLVENDNGEKVPYTYGTRWLYRDISETDWIRIKALFE
jgi:hypothetical protein